MFHSRKLTLYSNNNLMYDLFSQIFLILSKMCFYNFCPPNPGSSQGLHIEFGCCVCLVSFKAAPPPTSSLCPSSRVVVVVVFNNINIIRSLSQLSCRMFHDLILSFLDQFQVKCFWQDYHIYAFHYITSGGTVISVSVIIGDAELGHDVHHLC